MVRQRRGRLASPGVAEGKRRSHSLIPFHQNYDTNAYSHNYCN
ncbi:hypothetical protein QUB80_30085 [Chlorogloeopsis sp. ULAP01]|nr:hypothetical protein [Chlorogloeopsis sp. ULAP01]MDM9384911.1 hypothetical protein [Chlorogloeopsis sp. ULAP01]